MKVGRIVHVTPRVWVPTKRMPSTKQTTCGRTSGREGDIQAKNQLDTCSSEFCVSKMHSTCLAEKISKSPRC